MRRRIVPVLVVLSACGCRSGSFNQAERVVNRLTQTRCYARKLPPGTKYIDYDHGGGWVQLGEDGKAHPIPVPDEKSPQGGR